MLRCLLTRLKRIFCLKQKREEEPQPGLFLRIGKAKLWKQAESGEAPTVEKAVTDLYLRDRDKGLSLYGLREESETDKLACFFSLTLRDNPGHFEYVLFPASVLSGYRIDPVPVPEHPRFLSERHYEIPEPSEEQLLELAGRILSSPGKRVGQIMKQRIVNVAVQSRLLEMEELRGRVGDRWRMLIEQKKAKMNLSA